MAKLSKRMRAIKGKLEQDNSYMINDAITLLSELSQVKFTESIDVAINLGVDPRKSDQVVRGATVLPHGVGRKVRVLVFAQGKNADLALEAGADKVGFEDLVDWIKQGNLDFDVVIASPDAMPVVGKLGQILGPRGLMPNPKVGTVTNDVATAVKNAKYGQVRYRTDKAGIIHCAIGRIGFAADAVKENLEALLSDLKKAKPSSAKGTYIKKIAVSTTMGPGLTIDQTSLAI